MTTTTRVRELTVPIDDGARGLARAADVLGDAEVNVRGYAFHVDEDGGEVRFVVDDPERAKQALDEAGYAFDERPAIVTRVPHEPGELSRVAKNVISEVDVASSYVVVESTSGMPQLAFAFGPDVSEEVDALASEAESLGSQS